MTLPGGPSESGRVVGRYIGSQGPLPNTVGDFWRMVWEQRVRLLLMLTAETEGRRVKCHRYWPQRGETTARHGHLAVSCTGEHKTSSATVRDFQLTSDTVSITTTTQKQTLGLHGADFLQAIRPSCRAACVWVTGRAESVTEIFLGCIAVLCM